ncbi:hypothetical protein [Paenibacillus senegalimassiliensis]|uniref:hypothetical protein n=1 Tax=Paenibacillus senegalimassiliensis TaxID=1737426 RepID=UPI00073E3EF4|nr:hypothetical protein [Paenibacillus senegalimassiliensis]
MIWRLVLLLLVVVAGAVQIPFLLKARSMRDLVMFCIFLGITLAWLFNDLVEGPNLRPLDWIRFAMEPLKMLNPK